MDLKFDQRENKRLKCEAIIWHDNLLPEIYYTAKMYNLSKSGVYFESDRLDAAVLQGYADAKAIP